MKFQTLPVKRNPVPKGLFRRLHAVTHQRRQRVAAAASAPAPDLDIDDGSSKISRALFVIFLIHIVAIALIFFHQRYLDGRPVGSAGKPPAAAAPAGPRQDLPRLSSGEKPYIVRTGDNYTRIAIAEGVDETELRALNNNVDIGPGLILKVPPKRIVAEEPPEVLAIRSQTPSDHGRGLVENIDVSGAPKAVLVRPNPARQTHAPARSAKTHVVKPGESIYGIAGRYKVSQQALLEANKISDPRKLRAGMKLAIPTN